MRPCHRLALSSLLLGLAFASACRAEAPEPREAALHAQAVALNDALESRFRAGDVAGVAALYVTTRSFTDPRAIASRVVKPSTPTGLVSPTRSTGGSIVITQALPKLEIVYVLPCRPKVVLENTYYLNFEGFAEVIERSHDDPLSRGFARSLRTWAEHAAGDPAPSQSGRAVVTT